MRYLLDTDVLSNLVRRPQGRIAERIVEVGGDRVCTSVMVAAELRYGAARKGSSCYSTQVAKVLATLTVMPSSRLPMAAMVICA